MREIWGECDVRDSKMVFWFGVDTVIVMCVSDVTIFRERAIWWTRDVAIVRWNSAVMTHDAVEFSVPCLVYNGGGSGEYSLGIRDS